LLSLSIGYNFRKNIILPKKLKKITLFHVNSSLINNLPENIEQIFIKFDNFCFVENELYINNLPNSLKEIIIIKKQFEKYIKIPFGCKLTIINDDD
jgi:hypothetical protein